MTLFWLILPITALSILLWCCIAISGDIAEEEEQELGLRRS